MKKTLSMVLALVLLFALAVPAFATDTQALTQAENTEPNIDTTTSVEPVDQVLINYKEKFEELNKQFDGLNTRSTTRYATQVQILKNERNNQLRSLGYDVYSVNSNTYDNVEAALNTDLSQFSIEKNDSGTYLIIVGETAETRSTVLETYNYTYNGTTFQLRTLRVTTDDNGFYTQSNSVVLLNSNSVSAINTFLNGVLSVLVSQINNYLGTIADLIGFSPISIAPVSNASGAMTGTSSWTRLFTQVYSNYDAQRLNGSSVGFVQSITTVTFGGYFDGSPVNKSDTTNQFTYSPNYSNTAWRKQNGVIGYLSNGVIHDTTGSVKYQHGNTTYITHNEII